MSKWRFRKSLKITPGIRLNLASGSVGVSAGIKGARVGVNSKNGLYSHLSIPGTGIYRRTYHNKEISNVSSTPQVVVKNEREASSEDTIMYKIGRFFAQITNSVAPKEIEHGSGANSVGAYPYVFANLDWGISEDQIKLKLQERGYVFAGMMSDHILHFKGTIMDEDANIGVCIDSQKKLVKVGIFLNVSKDHLFEIYDKFCSVFVSKYGKPSDVWRHETGRSLATFWGKNGELSVKFGKSLEIIIYYLGPGWEAWNEQREIENVRDL